MALASARAMTAADSELFQKARKSVLPEWGSC